MDAVAKKGSKKTKDPVKQLVQEVKDIPAAELSPNCKQKLRALLLSQTEEYLANGGEIEELPNGLSGDASAELSQSRRYWKDLIKKSPEQARSA